MAEQGFVGGHSAGCTLEDPPALPRVVLTVGLYSVARTGAEAQRIYLRDGRPYDEGETISNPDYARTLRHLARHGADDFYHGELAERMSAATWPPTGHSSPPQI